MLLRTVLLLDSAVLVALGGSFVTVPAKASGFFGFGELPPPVHHLIGLWGCALLTLGVGYFICATNPLRHRVMIQIGILRGACEVVLGIAHVVMGLVTFAQAATGIVAGGLIAVAYSVLYPKAPAAEAAAADDAEQNDGSDT